MEQPNEVYEEREELNDIVVPEQEYTKEVVSGLFSLLSAFVLSPSGEAP